MKCNIKCYWNYNGQCCPECEEDYDSAKPNDEENCPTFLIHDFEEQFWNTYDEIKELIKERKFNELTEIRNFIKNQRRDV